MARTKSPAALALALWWAAAPVFAAGAPNAMKTQAAGSAGGYLYVVPRPLDFLTKIPGDIKGAFQYVFRKESLMGWGVMGVATGMMIANDQILLRQGHRLGDRWNIPHTSTGKTLLKTKVPFSKKQPALRGPYDLGSALYFIGDGEFHLCLAAGFLTVGFAASDNRALQTASQMAETYIASGIMVQVVKRSTGREDPNKASVSGGRWRFFPSPAKYNKEAPKYDAFPSGHLTSATAVATVIAENYSEYKFIWPLSCVMLTALSFQMVNNGVHWAGDYPLAMGMGYVFGHVAVQRGRRAGNRSARSSLELSPLVMEDGAGVRASWRF